MKIKELLSHFENERQWVDICHPVLARTTGTIADIRQEEQVMEMEFSKWRMNVLNTLEIDI